MNAAAAADELAFASLTGAAAWLRAGKVSPVELVRACLGRIESQNPLLNAFITVTAESALREAHAAEAEMRRGAWRGPLHGIPVALKDMIDTSGVRTTGASAVYLDRIPGADAAVVSRLKRAGAIVLGKLNMQEFAIGASSVPSHFGPVRNPWDTSRIAGGSSGGSAAAVAAGLCFAALGTDTGGSVRQPAALCGIVGLKPTYGRVSNLGVLPLAPSLDHVGPLTRNVEDCATVLEAIAGYEPADISSERRPLKLRPWPRSAARVRVGVPRAFFYEGLHPAVHRAVEAALATLSELGARIEEVPLEVSTDRTVFQAEAYASHAELIAEGSGRYLPETLAKLRRGAAVEAPAYMRAHRALGQLRREIAGIFTRIDVLATPTAPVPAPRLADYPQTFDEVVAWEASTLLRNTRPFNGLGIPTVTVPCGRTDEDLPVGLQLAAGPWQERRALALALAYESATAWHTRRPGGSASPSYAARLACT
jgi:aspartyl-tRNA(Asn)/glutamyl-tRNA(Gln) amidotransferase subunit A